MRQRRIGAGYADFLAALEREREGERDRGYVRFEDVARQLEGEERSRVEDEIVRLVQAGDALLFDLAVELDLAEAIVALERIRDHGEQWVRERAAGALARRR